MVAEAFRQWLVSQGLAPVFAGALGDHVRGTTAWAVHAEPQGGRKLYEVAVQVIARADDFYAAMDAAAASYIAMMAARNITIDMVHPSTAVHVPYPVTIVRPQQRPTWFPTSTVGEQVSCNFRVLLRDPSPAAPAPLP